MINISCCLTFGCIFVWKKLMETSLFVCGRDRISHSTQALTSHPRPPIHMKNLIELFPRHKPCQLLTSAHCKLLIFFFPHTFLRTTDSVNMCVSEFHTKTLWTQIKTVAGFMNPYKIASNVFLLNNKTLEILRGNKYS